jgi:hypothetical protein
MSAEGREDEPAVAFDHLQTAVRAQQGNDASRELSQPANAVDVETTLVR